MILHQRMLQIIHLLHKKGYSELVMSDYHYHPTKSILTSKTILLLKVYIITTNLYSFYNFNSFIGINKYYNHSSFLKHRGGDSEFSKKVIDLKRLSDKIFDEYGNGKYIFIQTLKNFHINLRIYQYSQVEIQELFIFELLT